MSTRFDSALRWILEAEGGYVNDPHDPGGETKYGISKGAYPDVDIRALTEEQAANIYRTDYWDKVHADKLPAPLDLYTFDAAVLQGPRTAVRQLQRAVGAKADGIMGRATQAAAKKAGAEAGDRLLAIRAAYLAGLRKKRYMVGWMRRLFRLQRFILDG